MSDQTHSTRNLEAWRERISAELKDPATVDDLGLAIAPGIHVSATHVQAPDGSGVHHVPQREMRYEPLVRSVSEWRALQKLDPEIGGRALLNAGSENDGFDGAAFGSDEAADLNVHVPPDSDRGFLRRLMFGERNDRVPTHTGMLIDPLAALCLASDGDGTADGSIRNELLEQGSERPVIGCVDAYALDSAGAAAPTMIAFSLLSLAAWLDNLDVGDLEAGGRLERIRILAPVGNRPMVDAALLTAVRDLSSALIRQYSQQNEGPERPVSPVLHAISSRSSVVRSAAPADDAGNLVRTTLQAVAASSAGADILSLLPYDAHRSADADSIRLSAGIHRMLRHESGLHRTSLPYAGSYAFETIVRRISDLAWSRFVELVRQGSAGDSPRFDLLNRWILEDQGAVEHPVRVGLDRYVPDRHVPDAVEQVS